MKRKQYDAYGSAGFDPGASSSGQSYWRGGPTVDPEELFRKIFGEFSSSSFGDFQSVFDQPQEVSSLSSLSVTHTETYSLYLSGLNWRQLLGRK